MTNFKNLQNQFGEYTKDGKEYALTQAPYVAATETAQYEALAIDTDGNEYELTWLIDNPEADDTADDVSDWNNFSARKL